MTILQSQLPYAIDALEPHVSAETMSYHYDKHHSGYVNKLNALIKGTPYETLSLEQIITRARLSADMDVLNIGPVGYLDGGLPCDHTIAPSVECRGGNRWRMRHMLQK